MPAVTINTHTHSHVRTEFSDPHKTQTDSLVNNRVKANLYRKRKSERDRENTEYTTQTVNRVLGTRQRNICAREIFIDFIFFAGIFARV